MESFFLHWNLICTLYLQNTSIKRCLARFHQNVYFRCFFVCSLSPSIINYACPNLHTTCTMALIFCFSTSLNSQRFLPFHLKVMLVAYVNSCFIIICQNFFPLLFSSRISEDSGTTVCRFSSTNMFFLNNRLRAFVVTGHLRSYE